MMKGELSTPRTQQLLWIQGDSGWKRNRGKSLNEGASYVCPKLTMYNQHVIDLVQIFPPFLNIWHHCHIVPLYIRTHYSFYCHQINNRIISYFHPMHWRDICDCNITHPPTKHKFPRYIIWEFSAAQGWTTGLGRELPMDWRRSGSFGVGEDSGRGATVSASRDVLLSTHRWCGGSRKPTAGRGRSKKGQRL